MKKYVCECLGTLFLVFFGCGSVAITGTMYQLTPVVAPFAFGFVIIAMAFAIGNVSGCHVNPAVSLAMFLDKRLSGKDLIGYLIGQFVGAFVGAALLFYLLTDSSLVAQYGLDQFGLGANGYESASTFGTSMSGAIIAEIVLTFVFVLTALAATANKKTAPYAGVIIGLTLALVHIVGIPLTGTSVNPARSFGPALMMYLGSGNTVALEQLWVFIVSPLAGSMIAYLFWTLIASKDKKEIVAAPKPATAPQINDAPKPTAPKPAAPKAAPKPAAPKANTKPATPKADTKAAASKAATKPAATTAKKTETSKSASSASKSTASTKKTTTNSSTKSSTSKKPAAKSSSKATDKTTSSSTK